MTKTKAKTSAKNSKDFVLKVLKYGLHDHNYKRILPSGVSINYNGGENWNSAYGGDWYDIHIPILLPKHKILTKKDLENDDVDFYSRQSLESLLEDLGSALKVHFKVHNTCFSVGNDMLYIEIAVNQK